MDRLKLRGLAVVAAGVLCSPIWLGLLAGPAGAATLEVIASNLDSPRGLAFGPTGALYVAEAGRGGDGACIQVSSGNQVCYGATGAVTRIWKGKQLRVATGLPSLALPDGSEATGPQDIAFNALGVAQVVVGLGASATEREALGEAGRGFGRLIATFAGGKKHTGADIAAYEEANNPDGGSGLDSNPYSVTVRAGKRAVADAGGNSLLSVDASNTISTLAVFAERLVDAPPFLGLPPGTQIPMQSVPNAVAVGPDGAYYVGELTGFPFPVGAARVYRVVAGHPPEVFAEGFTNIIDIAFAPDGSLYVLEYAKNGLLSGDPTGALLHVASDGTATTVASEGLVSPTGLAIASDGAIYVSNYGFVAGQGQVVRVRPTE